MIEWAHKVPNDRLIRYYIVGNLERVLLLRLVQARDARPTIMTTFPEIPPPSPIFSTRSFRTAEPHILLSSRILLILHSHPIRLF
jgi:hypothetical protein